ncbi:ShlB/FhaC/HecB family hemolysin secretion/activation protein [Ideonella paludis]|uniref:Haemolysin activator HlyB C-terminal domain-containing protein n=1 Tax=Ideonella paludis TaxID=1233411 RepID=A0ABS5E0E2_9BURK|nr:ShlB/FhaC/HecB family hemolysin secretion/activation protein [Ideonella paludis]MBQ0936882.1 hypothetical protein [Ideonella paludis]
MSRAQGTAQHSRAEHRSGVVIVNLAELEIEGHTVLAQSAQRYWQKFLGKPVHQEDLQQFRWWLTEESKREGMLVFAQAASKLTQDGREVLILNLTTPTIHAVHIEANNDSLDQDDLKALGDILSKQLLVGSPLDVGSLDQHLDRASFYLPLNIEATVKPVGPELVDVVIHVNAVERQWGEVQNVLLQINNHGLRQFGKPQILGRVSLGGWTPHASAQLTALLSQGISHLSADYEFLTPFLRGRARVFSAYSGSRSIQGGDASTQGRTRELGLGLSRQEAQWRDLTMLSNTEFATRHSMNSLVASNATTGDIREDQWRWSLALSNERVQRFPVAANVQFASGHLRAFAGEPLIEGRYYKVQAGFNIKHPLSADGHWYGQLKAQAQRISRSVDSYNKFSIGGQQGVRAYTSADGVGDEGAVGSVELHHKLGDGLIAGLFYDAGRIRPSKNQSSASFEQPYSLKAMGVQWISAWKSWRLTGYIAKGLGTYKMTEAQASTAESKPGALRVSFALSLQL